MLLITLVINSYLGNICYTLFPSPANLFSIYSYTWQVLEETLRYSITAPFAARVSNDKDLTIGGHLVPAGIPITLAIGVLLSDEKYFPDLEK